MTDITTPTPTSPSTGEPSAATQAAEEAASVASTAAEQASSVASTATEQAKTVASTAVDEAKTVGAQAATEAKDLLADARQQLRTQASEQSDRLAEAVRQVGEQLRTMAGAGDGLARDVVSQVADQAQQLSSRLSDGGLDRTLEDARRLARNRPGMFLLGAAAAGFVAARVARSADTQALAEAAKPSQTSNGIGNGQPGLAPAPAFPSSPQPPRTETVRTSSFDTPGAPS